MQCYIKGAGPAALKADKPARDNLNIALNIIISTGNDIQIFPKCHKILFWSNNLQQLS